MNLLPEIQQRVTLTFLMPEVKDGTVVNNEETFLILPINIVFMDGEWLLRAYHYGDEKEYGFELDRIMKWQSHDVIDGKVVDV